MWRDICLANRDSLLVAIDDYLGGLTRLRDTIAAGEGAQLEAYFSSARAARAKWLRKAGR